jgi:hypothetical protein
MLRRDGAMVELTVDRGSAREAVKVGPELDHQQVIFSLWLRLVLFCELDHCHDLYDFCLFPA